MLSIIISVAHAISQYQTKALNSFIHPPNHELLHQSVHSFIHYFINLYSSIHEVIRSGTNSSISTAPFIHSLI